MNEAISKREQTLIKKYGSREALKAKRREWQAKSRVNYKGTGGFASLSKEQRQEISRKANAKRWGTGE